MTIKVYWVTIIITAIMAANDFVVWEIATTKFVMSIVYSSITDSNGDSRTIKRISDCRGIDKGNTLCNMDWAVLEYKARSKNMRKNPLLSKR